MNSIDVVHTLSLLSSSKVKESKYALDELTNLLKQNPALIPTKLLSSAAENLLETLVLEHTKYCNLLGSVSDSVAAKVSLSESRLSAIAYVLRLFIEKTCSRFKLKTLKLFLAAMPELMVNSISRNLLRPVADHLTFALLALIKGDLFQLKYTSEQWRFLVKHTCRYLSDQLQKSINDRNVSNFVSILNVLIVMETTALQYVLDDLHQCMVKFLQLSQKENANTRSFLCLVNEFLLRTHCCDVKRSLLLIHDTWCYYINIGGSSNISIRKELNYLDIIASELLNNNLPAMIGDDESESIVLKESLVSVYQDYLIIRLQEYIAADLPLSAFACVERNTEEYSWFDLIDFALERKSDPYSWLYSYGIVKLLATFYRITASNADTVMLFKKRKLSTDFGALVKASTSMEDFICSSLDCENSEIQKAGLQFCCFYSSIYLLENEQATRVKEAVFQKFENLSLSGWACLSLIPLISQSSESLSSIELCRLIKICMPFLKSAQLCNASCMLLSHAFRHSSDCHLDKTSLTQIFDVYELPEINGPTIVSNASFIFWKDMQQYGNTFQLQTKNSVGTCIGNWLVSKWGQFDVLKDDQDQFFTFLAWLCQLEVPAGVFFFNSLQHAADGRYELWSSYREQREFILQQSLKECRYSKNNNSTNIIHDRYLKPHTDTSSINEILYRLLEKAEGNLETLTIENFKWVCQVIKIAEQLQGATQYANYFDGFEKSMAMLIPKLAFSTPEELISVAETLASLNAGKAARIIFDSIQVDSFITFYKSTLRPFDAKDHLDGFNINESVSSERVRSSQSLHSAIGFQGKLSVCVASLVILIYQQRSHFDITSCCKDILLLLEDSSPKYLLDLLPPIIRWLQKEAGSSFITDDFLDQLAQIMGHQFLGTSYNTYNAAVPILCDFLDVTMRKWIENAESSLHADCSDMFEWITARVEDKTINGAKAIIHFTKLLLHMLENHDILRGTIKGGKQKLFSLLIDSLHLLDCTQLCLQVPDVVLYMQNVSYRNQLIVFEEMIAMLDSPQQSIERSAVYCMMLQKLSTVSSSLLVRAIEEMLRYTSFKHTRVYVALILKIMSQNMAFASISDLFDKYRYEILSFWFDTLAEGDGTFHTAWDIELFGFDDKSLFLRRYQIDISAIYFSRSSKGEMLIKEVEEQTGLKKAQLLENSLHLAVPLAYTTTGIKDAIFDILTDLLGKVSKKWYAKRRILLVRWLLHFCDFGSFTEMARVLSIRYPSSSIGQEFSKCHKSAFVYQFPMHITTSVGLKLLEEYSLDDSLKENFVSLLLVWILADLSKVQSIAEKIQCIREISCLLIIFGNAQKYKSNIVHVICSLCSYLQNSKMHEEVAVLIVLLLRKAHDLGCDLTEPLLAAFSSSLAYRKLYQKPVSTLLQEELSKVGEYYDGNISYQRTWNFAISALKGKRLGIETYHNDEILDRSDCSLNSVVLLSLLFDATVETVELSINHVPSERAIRNLCKYDVPTEYVSSNFLLWSAAYVAAFYSSTNDLNVVEDSIVMDPSALEHIFRNPGSLYLVYEKLFKYVECGATILDPSSLFVGQSACSCLFDIHSASQEKLHGISISDFPEETTRLDKETFALMHSNASKDYSFDSFIAKICFAVDSDYFTWVQYLSGSLLSHLSYAVSTLANIIPLCDEDVEFAEIIMPALFHILLYYDTKVGPQLCLQLLDGLDKLLETKQSQPKVKVMFQLVMVIRAGARAGLRLFSNVYKSLNLRNIYEVAIRSNKIHFAYMIFEEYYMDYSVDIDYVSLGAIYQKFDNQDFIAGLSAAQSLRGVFDAVNKSESNHWKRFQFSNAFVDANYGQLDNSNRSLLVKATDCNGFYGLSSMIDVENAEFDTRKYKWGISLNNWEIPVPNKVGTKEEAFYHVLKNVSGSSTSTMLESIITVVKSKQCFETIPEWLETVAETFFLTGYLHKRDSGSSIVKEARRFAALDRFKLKSLDFEDYKLNIEARYSLSRIMFEKFFANKDNFSLELWLASLAQLGDFITLAIAEKHLQDALRISVVLEKILDLGSRMDVNDPLSNCVSQFSSFIFAKTLWSFQEKSTSVKIMKSLLTEKELKDFDPAHKELVDLLTVSKDRIATCLVKWTSESRLETPSSICENYVDNITVSSKDYSTRAQIFYTLAEFFNTEGEKINSKGEIGDRQLRCDIGFADLQSLKAVYSNSLVPENERKDAKRHYNKLKLQYERDLETLNDMKIHREQFVSNALHYYLNAMIFADDYDDDILDKFCGLWFEHDNEPRINVKLHQEIGTVPSWKFLPWVNQIASKLSTDSTEFQKPLQLTMKRLLFKLPFDSLYSVMGILFYGKNSVIADTSIQRKVEAAEGILKELQAFEKGLYFQRYVFPVQQFCEMSVELANTPVNKQRRALQIKTLKDNKYWQLVIAEQKLPLPTINVPITSSSQGKAPRPYITGVKESIDISSTGISMPKIVTFYISNGTRHKVLMKGSNDDLRQDAIMEQVFKQVNNILRHDKQMRKLDLYIRTYEVIPLGPKAGIIEFVPNSLSLHQVLLLLHRNDSLTFDDARQAMKRVQTKSNAQRLEVYDDITSGIAPQLRNFFFDTFPAPDEWLNAKMKYTKGTAATSIVGYILGLGDRHLNNILLDKRTGEPIHIDLGIAFDQGKLLPIPELVPFRLTRDMVDGFGVTGADGLFRKSCEHLFKVLQQDYSKVLCVLNILKWDPLYSWVMSPVRKHKHLFEEEQDEEEKFISLPLQSGLGNRSAKQNENQESYRALKGVEEKLNGSKLSVEATVQELIQQATDPNNLSVIYMGWSPFY